ncbi:MAG: peptide/nickel transport system permease protein [Solirubrobacteraceae bacterium]|jgi:peptide/nickel transport system permease protein|nr:peptide/nickel transport system permease protein [Solirubrobacteraceae bacterium]
MTTYIIRRILWGIVLLILVSALTFLFFDVFPSADPAILRAGRNSSPATIAHIRHELGLDQPIYTQFVNYMKGIILHFNFGYSYYSGASVLSLITNRLPATLSLTVGAAVVWLLSGIPIGIISAIRRGTLLDRTAMGVALVFVSMPVFWFGIMLLFLFSNDIGRYHIFPGAASYVGLTSSPVDWFTSLILPWIVLAGTSAAIYSRLLRGSLIEAMGEDYIRTARAKGLAERRVVWRHGVRSAITPVVTIFGLDVGTLLGGAVITETVFDIPGIGRLNWQAIINADFPIVQGTVLLAAIFIVVANIIVDISYAYLDPRVRYS